MRTSSRRIVLGLLVAVAVVASLFALRERRPSWVVGSATELLERLEAEQVMTRPDPLHNRYSLAHLAQQDGCLRRKLQDVSVDPREALEVRWDSLCALYAMNDDQLLAETLHRHAKWLETSAPADADDEIVRMEVRKALLLLPLGTSLPAEEIVELLQHGGNAWLVGVEAQASADLTDYDGPQPALRRRRQRRAQEVLEYLAHGREASGAGSTEPLGEG